MDPTIKERLDSYLSKGVYPFHMPGHKRRDLFLPGDWVRYDVTELPGMDNLHAAEGMILDAQRRVADLYGADESYLLVNGATAGMTAAVAASCGEGGCIIVARNCHKSIYGGLVFSGAMPVYVQPEETPYGFAGGVTPHAVEKALSEHNGVKAVCITSPTYEGCTSDIRRIAEAVHAHNAILIVDEAHGAHFPFHEAFPCPAIAQGADIAVNSFHKTLPLPSQCGVLHVRGGRADRVLIQKLLAVLQTSSPSYLFMTLMDHVTGFLRDRPECFEAYVHKINDFREAFPNGEPIALLGEGLAGHYGIQEVDRGKLVFYIRSGDMPGAALAEELARHKLQMEMSGPAHVLAMTSVADEDSGFYMLSEALRTVMVGMARTERSHRGGMGQHASLPVEICCSPRQAFFLDKEEIQLTQGHGRIAGDFVTPYPPGIPLLVPGEKITEPAIERILELQGQQVAILGIHNMNIQALKEMEI